MQVEEVEQPMPASMPSTASLPRGPVMLPVDEPIQWIRGDLIGAGAFGRVYAGLDESTGQLMAVKQVQPHVSTERHVRASACHLSSF